jgi:hypothetical protein
MVTEFKIGKVASVLLILTAVAVLNSVSYAEQLNLKEILSKPGVAEQMQASYSGKSTYDGQQDTPLVVQAKKFALRINPPPPPEPVQRPTAENRPVRPKAEVSASFKLLGTSYHFGDAAQSWALIDEVGKGMHWVKQGGKVGHLNIEKVGDGSVLINDNGRKYELVAERKNMPDLVKSYSGQLEKSEPVKLLEGVEKPEEKTVTAEPAATVPQVPAVEQVPAEPEPTPEEQLQKTQENIEWLKQIQSEGMSESEANELEGLGQMLKMLEDEAKNLQQQSGKGDANAPKQDANAVSQPETQAENNTAAGNEPNKSAQSTRIRRIRTAK